MEKNKLLVKANMIYNKIIDNDNKGAIEECKELTKILEEEDV